MVIVVPTFPEGGSKYPSVNGMWDSGFRGGVKTAEYHALFKAVKDEAESQMAATRWNTADYYVELHWKRYVTTRRTFDAMNGLKVECDALQAAGVVRNDHLIRPFPDVPQYDPTPGAIDRIALVVIRTYPPAILAEKPARKLIDAPSPAFVEAQAEARRRTVNRPQGAKARTFDQLKSGDKLSWDELEMLKKKVGL